MIYWTALAWKGKGDAAKAKEHAARAANANMLPLATYAFVRADGKEDVVTLPKGGEQANGVPAEAGHPVVVPRVAATAICGRPRSSALAEAAHVALHAALGELELRAAVGARPGQRLLHPAERHLLVSPRHRLHGYRGLGARR